MSSAPKRTAIAAIVALSLASGAAAAPDPAAGKAPASPKLGKYHCVFFINGSLQTTPGFTLKAGGAYSHDNGGGGKVKYDAAAGVIEFAGGPLAGQAGKVEPNVVRLFNERRSRTVIDCDSR